MGDPTNQFSWSTCWDWSAVWDTKNGDFNACFQRTVLVWLPCCFLWLGAGCHYYMSTKLRRLSILNRPLNISQRIITLVLIVLELIDFAITFTTSYHSQLMIDHLNPAIKILTFSLALALQIFNLKKGITSSAMLFIFWLMTAICDFLPFQTQLRAPLLDHENDRAVILFVYTMTSYPLVLIQLVLHCFSDEATQVGKKTKSHLSYPEITSSLPSRLTFHWFWYMSLKGYKSSISVKDLWFMKPSDTAHCIRNRFSRTWLRLYKNQRNSNGEVKLQSIASSLLKLVPGPVISSFMYRLAADICAFLQPYLLGLLITQMESHEETWKCYLYASLMFIIGLSNSFLLVHFLFTLQMIGLRVRTAVVTAVAHKSLVSSSAARLGFQLGEVINFVSVDSKRFVDFAMYFHNLWFAPLAVAVGIYFLWGLLGVASISGLIIMILIIPLNTWIANMNKRLQLQQMKMKDERAKLMNEFLSGVKVIKMYAWESFFESQMNEIRNKELEILKKSAMLNAFNMFILALAPCLVSLFTFGTYVLMDEGNVLDARKVFVSLSYLNLMRKPVQSLPITIGNLTAASVSLKRINRFMNAMEIDPNDVSHDLNPNGGAISVKSGSFGWGCEAILHDINLDVEQGTLLAVVGRVGSGKTSLLSAILGEMVKLSGTVNTRGSVAYVAQQAWIQNATLRNNILFGSPYEPEKYQKVLEACALLPDLKILAAGDMTEIGERGLNLSGGQKQRVALARAVYKDASIYLLDDPLSAVDSHVGRHLFDQVIGPDGLLSQKTRVWVTHGLTFLPKVDSVAVMSDGKISQVGSFNELGQHQILEESHVDATATYASKHQFTSLVSETNGNEAQNPDRRAAINAKLEEDRKLERTLSRLSQRKASKDRLTTVEKMEEGAVKSAVYQTYVNAASPNYIFAAIVVLLAWQAFNQASKLWLVDWSAAGQDVTTDGDIKVDVSYYLGVYGAMNIGLGATSLLGNILLLLASVRAARCLYLRMFKRVMRSPMSFFDTTPVGRILNRFSMDVDVIDTTFPKNLQFTILNFFELIGTLVVISYTTPWVFLAVAPACALSVLFQKFYLATSRQLKRLESQTSSPINSQFSEVVTGAATIRAFGMQEQFLARFEETVDTNNMASYACLAAPRWLNVWIGSLSNVIVLLSAVFSVTSGIDTSSAGLCISHALNLSQLLNNLICSASEAETNIVAIERVVEYCHTEQEAAWHVPTRRPPSDWPLSGRITFHNYATRYRRGLSLVLKGVSCTILPGEKVGIVGRTGAGKSSLTLALFRIIEAAGGHIEIDGLKLADHGLHDVRGKITIIPQDPMLFSGPLRKNLDPFGKHSEADIWWALDCAHLKSFVQLLPSGIDFVIKEGGENLSVGQKQLVCLARALLWKTRVLILDEPTAAVDVMTDDLIQKTIQEQFKDCTVLTIAHRLNSIMNSDRVMVMDRGTIREFAAPQVLLEDTSSLFYSMAKVADIA